MAGGLLLTSSRAHTHTRLVVPTTSQHQPTSQDSQEQGPRIFGWRRPCFGEAPLARFREKQAQEGLTSSSKHTWEKAGGIPFFAAPGVSRVSRWAWHAFAISLSLSLSRFFASSRWRLAKKGQVRWLKGALDRGCKIQSRERIQMAVLSCAGKRVVSIFPNWLNPLACNMFLFFLVTGHYLCGFC